MATAASASAGTILELVRSGRARTRRDVQDLTGISRSTLSLRMTQLLEAGYVAESGLIAGSTGRPARVLTFDESRQLVLAVDLGAAHAHLAVIDAGGHVLAEARSGQRIDAGPDAVLRYVTKRLGDLLARSGRNLSEVAGIGIGIPGPVRFGTQRPNQPPLMPGWHDFPVAEWLSEALGVPAFVDNDANLMALGEARVHYADSPSVLFVKVGTGIGAGLILHGQPERGIAGGAGDIGHIRVVDEGRGRRCTCGATGCLATEASGGAIMRQLSELGIDAASSVDVVRLVMQGQPEAIRLIRDAGRLLGEVLASAVALLNPAALVLGGSLSGCGDYLLDAVRQEIFARTVPLATQELTIATSTLGGDAAVQGARHLVIDQTFSADAVDARLASHQ
ncbi:MAG TPA: ROK family protein [Glaciibacter sp.]|nr:ROK family protein [Glaciibacter sp.]